MSEGSGAIDRYRQLMYEYFDTMSAGGDFARFFTEDVTWVDTDTGKQVSGPDAVRDHIHALHTRMFDARPEGRALVVADGHAFVEGEFVGTATDVSVPFCVAYDLDEAGISAMRFYMSFAPLLAHAQRTAGPAATRSQGEEPGTRQGPL